jgi:uncharacterized protein (DUF2249 family)
MSQNTGKTIDVRQIVPRERHPLIFQTFHGLAKGEAFELVNDHDPKPLYYQFAAEYPQQFSWDYLEQGPQVWRVRIGKAADTQTTVVTNKTSG